MSIAAESRNLPYTHSKIGSTSFAVIAFVPNCNVGQYRTAIKPKQSINLQRPILDLSTYSVHLPNMLQVLLLQHACTAADTA